MGRHPIRLAIAEDLRRSRLTVFFRLLLALPHIVWLVLWSIVVVLVEIVNWFATLFTGTSPEPLHNFLARYMRYSTHVNAFVLLAANPFPGFAGAAGSYPIDLEIDPPMRQNRWKTGFRAILALPAAVLGSTLSGGSVGFSSGGSYVMLSISLAIVAAFLGWWASLVRGTMPVGLSRALAYALAYSAQVGAYTLLLTDRYPSADPLAVRLPAETDDHPVRLANSDDGVRSRATVFFRALLAIPLLVWVYLWSIAAALVGFINWFAVLFTGRSPDELHSFLASYLRFRTHVGAYLSILANPYPGFLGEAGSYPVDLEIAGPERQNRWKTFFRLLLAVPAFLVVGALGLTHVVVGVFGWFASVFTGSMPRGLQRLGAYCLRYEAQTYCFMYLLTDRYPYAGPEFDAPAVAQAQPLRPEPEPIVA